MTSGGRGDPRSWCIYIYIYTHIKSISETNKFIRSSLLPAQRTSPRISRRGCLQRWPVVPRLVTRLYHDGTELLHEAIFQT